MGTLSYVDGRIEICADINWRKINGSRFNPCGPNYKGGGDDIKFAVEEFTDVIDEGVLITKRVVGIEPWSSNEYKAYHIVEHVQEAIDEIRKIDPDATFTDYLEGHDDADNHWRIAVVDGQATKIKGEITYPPPVDDASPIDARTFVLQARESLSALNTILMNLEPGTVTPHLIADLTDNLRIHTVMLGRPVAGIDT